LTGAPGRPYPRSRGSPGRPRGGSAAGGTFFEPSALFAPVEGNGPFEEAREVDHMVTKITDGITGFIWTDYRQNNCNTYLIDAGARILVDPGHSHLFDHVEKGLAALGINRRSIDLVVVTHAHPDHMESALLFESPTMKTFPREDFLYIKRLAGDGYPIPEPDFFLVEGDLEVGNTRLQVIHTPGHTPGSVCLFWPEKGALFCGDVIFVNGIGRTDLPGSSAAALKESIKRLKSLDAQIVLPGHGRLLKGRTAVTQNFATIEHYWFSSL